MSLTIIPFRPQSHTFIYWPYDIIYANGVLHHYVVKQGGAESVRMQLYCPRPLPIQYKYIQLLPLTFAEASSVSLPHTYIGLSCDPTGTIICSSSGGYMTLNFFNGFRYHPLWTITTNTASIPNGRSATAFTIRCASWGGQQGSGRYTP